MTSFKPTEGHTTPAAALTQDFREIAHSGGKIIFDISADSDGRTQFRVTFTGSRPVPMSMFGVYALPQGIPVGTIRLGGIGQPWNPPPHPSCLPVFLASDSEGYFGHECPNCGKYWRSGTLVRVCPYCRAQGEASDFLKPAHLAYVRHYARTLFNGVKATQPGQSNQVSMARLFLNHNFIIPAQANRRDSSVSAVRWITISGADMDFAHAADGETTSQTFKRRSKSFERT